MEESLRTLILKEFPHDEIDIRTYSPGTLAFLGDAVYSLVIRTIHDGRGEESIQTRKKFQPVSSRKEFLIGGISSSNRTGGPVRLLVFTGQD